MNETGSVKIAPEVILTVAKRTVLAVPGVTQLAPRPMNLGGVFRSSTSEGGIAITLSQNIVTVYLSLVVEPDVNIAQVGTSVQQAVKRSIEEIVGMQVATVNIQVEDVRFEAAGT